MKMRKGVIFSITESITICRVNLRYEDYEDEDDDSSQTPSITNSEFQKKLKSNKRLESLYKLRFSIEKIFLSRKATIFYKLMCSYGKLIMVKNTMKIFGKIIEQMKRKREKIGMVKIKRIWYFGTALLAQRVYIDQRNVPQPSLWRH